MAEHRSEVRATGKRVLFVCAGNTCRSLMAEFIGRERFGDSLETLSAGLRPQQPADAANAIYTLKAVFNIDASWHVPKDVRQVELCNFDLVITMDQRVARKFADQFPDFPTERLLKWKIDDPYGDDLAEYRRCGLAILKQLKILTNRA
jgi:protein-tyrosine-phosphatase